MRLLDRYIIRQFLLNTLIVSFVLTGLFVLVDFIIDVDEFLKAGRMWATTWSEDPSLLQLTLGTLWGLWDFYMPMVVLLFVYFCGLFVVAGAGFTFAGMIRTRELVAMVTSGMSMYRIAAPVIVTGVLVIAATLPVQEYLVPKLAAKLARSKSHLKVSRIKTFPVHFVPDGQGSLLSAASFEAGQQVPRLRDVNIIERDPATGSAARRIVAAEAFWNERRHGWDLNQGYALRPASGTGIAGASALPSADDIEVVEFYATPVTPDVLLAKRESIYVRLLSLQELIRLRSNPAADQAQVAQVMWSRFSMLLVNMLVLVMTLPLFLLREPGNMLVQAAKVAGLALGAWGGALVLFQVGSASSVVNPVTAAWLPVALYLPLTAGLLLTVRT